ncbi:hypothetical protein [Candidatus Nitronereus thalassa]|uniref:NACHT-NTPase and P-loop NTPases N-terminal domain-containing protein n=1 Tax=Candidatus Nitronereus thalassa TaxID=3020898 RepID=A0ABU3KDT5_9BACT|nr:hypothetical protein [Candidatus Nitronereus thalassa]MDT7044304.1 hypothetical protein [Candidatus Nitronereus thalassa]
MFGIAETIFNVAKELFEIFTNLDEGRLKRTAKISDYFSNLAQTIEDTRASLKKGEYPHGKCEELRFHAQNMKETIGDLIGQDKAEEYSDRVMQVWQIEGMHAQLGTANEQDKDKQLHILDEAAGYFRGVAAHLRVSG